MDETPKRKPGSIFKRAFFNQYNYMLLGGSGLFAATTQSWLPLLIGGGLEVLWLAIGADTGLFKKWVAKQESKEAAALAQAELEAAIAELPRDDRARLEGLREEARSIEELVRKNKGLESALLADELRKLSGLIQSFAKMAVVHARLEQHVRDTPGSDIERDIATAQRALKTETDSRVQASLKQSLSLAQKRLRQHERIVGAWKALGVQMDTLEKAFAYLKSHALALGTPEELSAELDQMVLGVASVTDLEAETAEMLAELSGGRRAAQVEARKVAGKQR